MGLLIPNDNWELSILIVLFFSFPLIKTFVHPDKAAIFCIYSKILDLNDEC